ncbi:hypothetical protein LCGC14_2799310, partial [marine sediment metagenome]
MDLQEAYLTLHKASGIKEGDKVKIVQKATGTDMGWNRCTAPGKDALVGSYATVHRDKDVEGFMIDALGGRWHFPFYCLELIEKVTPPLKIGDNEVKFTAEGIKVGCQSVTTEEVDEIHRRLHE